MAETEGIERLVARVVEEVRRRLGQGVTLQPQAGAEESRAASATVGGEVGQPSPRLVVLFTGGDVGLEEGIVQALALGRAGWRLEVVLSPRAEELLGRERFAPLREVGRVLGAGEVKSTLELLAGAEAVVVPVLTRNTATKVALLVTDSLATNLLLQALAMGKPVVAARNAADPAAALCACVGLPTAPPAINRMMEAYFRNLGELGLEMVKVSELAVMVAKRLGKSLSAEAGRQPSAVSQPRSGAKVGARIIITEADLAGAEPSQAFVVPADAIVTDLAREAAQRRGIEIRRR